MKTLTRLALALSLPLLASGASAATVTEKGNSLPEVSKLTYQARNHKTLFNSDRFARIDRIGKRLAAPGRKAAAASKGSDPDWSLPLTDQYEYMDGPQGSIYLCSTELEYEEIKYEYYTQKNIVGYKFKVYDTDFNLIGELKGKVKLDTTTDPDNPEIRVASMGLTPVLTTKFFNSDDKPEVMVYFNMNTPNYTVNTRSVAFQLGGEKDEEGNDVPICTINGNLCDVLDASTDKWNENFYLTFATDYVFPTDPADTSFEAYVNSQGVKMQTFKKAAYGTAEPVKVFEYDMRLNDWPGDQENASPLMSRFVNGKPYIIIDGYTDGLWKFKDAEDEYGFADQEWNSETKFFVDIYQPESLENPNLVQHTEIECIKHPGDNILATFYYIGGLGYNDDVDFGNCEEEGKANLVVMTKDWDGNDMGQTSSFYLYTPEGKLDAVIGEEVDGVLGMSDIEGQDPEYMFVMARGGEYTFEFVNPYKGEVHHSFKQVLPWQGEYEGLYVNADRVADGDSYKYCFELSTPGLDSEGNDLMRIAWINTDGEIESVDEVNMGKNIRMAKVYIGQEVLSPYTFDTSKEREYMIIVKRGTAFSSSVQEEFIISTASSKGNPVGRILFSLSPDDSMGNLAMVSTLEKSGSPMLWVIYYNNVTNQYSQLFYNLPLDKFAGGDGTAENPYKIATVGDLQCVRDNLAAHYEIINDFDASGFELKPIGSSQTPFRGSIKGNGHTISNLTIDGKNDYSAIFTDADQATISDINFVNPVVKIGNTRFNGLLAANIQRSTISGVHVYGLQAEGDTECSFGGLLGKASLSTFISDCSVANANINLPEARTVGGLVGETRTATTITASAFTGVINAKSTIGGILGTSGPNAGNVTDCHVDADITGANIIGGIIGDLDTRILVDHCYVEGSLTATEVFGTRIVQKGYALGGIAGMISNFYPNSFSSDGSSTTETEPNDVISNCFVNLESISTPELPEGNQKSVHRIAGFTSINNLEPDWDNVTDYNNIDTFLPTEPELGLKNNYVVASLAKQDSEIEAETTSTEGKDIAADDVNAEFFSGLGFKFGAATDAPWKETPENDPSLFHEVGSKFTLTEMMVEDKQSFDAELIVVSRKPLTVDEFIDGFACEISDETVLEMNGELTFNNNVASIGFNALKVGSAVVTANVNGTLSKLTVNVQEAMDGIKDVVGSDSSLVISFDGAVVSANGSLSVFTLDGRQVAAGAGRVSLASLSAGVYVVTAVDAAGNKAVRKFLLQ